MIQKSLLSLALGTFALGVSEFGMMSVISVVAQDMNISIPDAGDFISAYSIGVAAGAPCLPFLSKFRLKYILLFLCVVISAGNLLVAFAPDYTSFLLGRFLSGLPHGAYFGVGAILATRLAGYGEKAAAVAIMVSGMTFANIIGVPFCALLGNSLSWRLAFLFVAICGLLALGGIWKEIPIMPPLDKGGKGSIRRQFAFLKNLPPWLILAGVFFGQASLYCWYSYVEPIMLRVTHIPESAISLVMALAGTGMAVGALVAGKLTDKFPGGMVTGIICLLEIPTLLLIYLKSDVMPLALFLTFAGAAEIFALGGPLQYLIIRFSKGGEMLGGAAIQIAFNVSNALAAFMGGLAINAGLGITSPALVGIPFAIIAGSALFYLHYHCDHNKEKCKG